MSPHLLSVLTSLTPDSTVPPPPVLIPCVCQIKRPQLVWFSHVSAPCLHPPLKGMRSGSKCTVFCTCGDSRPCLLSPLPPPIYIHFLLPLMLLLLHMSASNMCNGPIPSLIIFRQKKKAKGNELPRRCFRPLRWDLCNV